jgi:phage terminase Nu1 subunit (DNA packaging protein)
MTKPKPKKPAAKSGLSADLITSRELSNRLKVPARIISAWKKEGLPLIGRYVPYNEAEEWLVMSGRITPPDGVVTSIDKLAGLLGYSPWHVRKWVPEDGFPGKTQRSVPQAKCGYFPVDRIVAWLKEAHPESRMHNREPAGSKQGTNGSPETGYRTQITKIKLERERIKLRREAEEVIDADSVQRFFERYNAYAITVLKQLPGMVDSKLPEDIDPETRGEIRAAFSKLLRESDYDEDNSDDI